MYIYIYIPTHMYTCTYIYNMYIHTYIYIHIHKTTEGTDLEAAEHEGAEDLVELCDEALLLLRVVDLEVEPLVELLRGAEHLGEEEVEERP
jgi:hypothetical protein